MSKTDRRGEEQSVSEPHLLLESGGAGQGPGKAVLAKNKVRHWASMAVANNVSQC